MLRQRYLKLLLSWILLTGCVGEPNSPGNDFSTLRLFDGVVFYDMYSELVTSPTPANVHRLTNTRYTTMLDQSRLNQLQNTLRLDITVGALCDNYDRLAQVDLALVPTGAERYVMEAVDRVELARFITPFMDKNVQPNEVLYSFNLDNAVPILISPEVRQKYDLWIEFEVTGTPGMAQQSVAGCAGRIDIFRGWLQLVTDSSSPQQLFDVFVPIAWNHRLNNYEAAASDALGKSRKTIQFEVDADSTNSHLVLITSNHGSNYYGEEYFRRDHFVYLDDVLVHEYKPGRESCEPFRHFNTRQNRIYGIAPKSERGWQVFSNWCPGDVIDTRIIQLGDVAAGPHSFTIDVPDAVFNEARGEIPVSVYFQGSAYSP